MPESDPQVLVSTAWLADHLNAPDVKILDGTLRLPGQGGDPRADYEAAHIPEARFFDIDEISDQSSPLPHMLPPVEKFVARVRAMGIGDGHRVIVYDQDGLFSAARVWWMFRVFGHSDVLVLDGGLKKWLAEGRPVDDMPPPPRERHFTGRKDASLVRDVTQVAAALKLDEAQVLDARAPGRFRGDEPEPRAGLRAGHMPGAKNLHYAALLNPDSTMKSVEETRALFEAAGVDLARPVITTCGSGVTAAILSLALARLGHRKTALYDGSWSEWGAYQDLPVARG
ncbi:3-mercaptopyruvate sulfurtransferase [Pikeienuella sp. HZG-20]|uniref:3-mercaptopyruvate sulfurtransferase n=1 Tax=Paludibacillus litoralis TaxID=3133267 RepID=UPI0030ECF1F0